VRLRVPEIKTGWIKLAAISAVTIGLLAFLGQATRLNTIRISGAKELDTGHLQRVAQEGASKQWFGRNALLLNTGALVTYIETAEPGVKSAQIKHRGFHTVEVVVTERQPSLNWKSNNILYLLDVDGTVIGPSKGSYVRLPTVTDSTNLPVKEGSIVAPASFVAFSGEFIRRLPEAGLQASEAIVPETTSELNIKTQQGYMLKLDTTRNAGSELDDLKNVQRELAKAHKAPTQYIDLRIEHKAYYK
jgi:cell division septal protein FtsQ